MIEKLIKSISYSHLTHTGLICGKDPRTREKHACDLCEATRSELKALHYHKAKVHGVVEGKFRDRRGPANTCEKCGKQIRSKEVSIWRYIHWSFDSVDSFGSMSKKNAFIG